MCIGLSRISHFAFLFSGESEIIIKCTSTVRNAHILIALYYGMNTIEPKAHNANMENVGVVVVDAYNFM